MTYGVTENGFVKKPANVILEEVGQYWRDAISPDLSLEPESPQGNIIAAETAALDVIWQILEDVYASGDLENLSGTALERRIYLQHGILRFENETDEELIKRATQPRQAGNIIDRAIKDVSIIDGVTYADVIYNDKDTAGVNGMPPRSWALVVDGGADADIAESFWTYFSGGVVVVGNHSYNWQDEHGICRPLHWVRPEAVGAELELDVVEDNDGCKNCGDVNPSNIVRKLQSEACRQDDDAVLFNVGQSVDESTIIGMAGYGAGYKIKDVRIKKKTDVDFSDSLIVNYYQYISVNTDDIKVNVL